MSYIGNAPISAAFLTDTFSGNGSTVAFTMTVAPANTSSIIVAITGVLQDPSTYSVSGTTLTFSAAPPSGTSNISVRYLGIPASGVTTTAYRTVTNFTATAGQTSFSGTLDLLFVDADAAQAALFAAIGSNPASLELFPSGNGSTGVKLSGEVIITGHSITVDQNDAVVASVTYAGTGALTSTTLS